MRLIDADTLYVALMKKSTAIARGTGLNCMAIACKAVAGMVKDAPTVDAEPVRHGEWEVVDAEEPSRYGCSECKRLVWHLENYCPNCGCRMLKEGDH